MCVCTCACVCMRVCVCVCVCLCVCVCVYMCVYSHVTSPLLPHAPLLHVLVRRACPLLEQAVVLLSHQSLSPKQSQLTVMDQSARGGSCMFK